MAELEIDDGELVLRLSLGEKILGVHGDARVPVSAVNHVEILENAHEPADHGIKVGERIPGVVEVGRIIGGGTKLFAAVHRSTPRGLRIELSEGPFDEWIVGCEDPEGVAARLGLPS
jgi:uncharacterized protein